MTASAPGGAGDAVADDRHHQHVRSRSDLAQAVRVAKLVLGEPVLLVHGVMLQRRQDGRATAYGEQGQHAEDANEGAELVHDSFAPEPMRWRCSQMAAGPTVSSTVWSAT